jgi:Tat protein secretion system quality control protein TatD with DNase activity
MLVRDSEVWKKVVKEGKGFIYNDFGTHFPGNSPSWNTKENNKLHKASCPHIKRMAYISENGLNKYFFNSKQEVIDWLNKNRASEGYSLCKTCKP